MAMNIKNPARFNQKLQEVMQGLYELFELSREHELSPVGEDGVVRYDEAYGKTNFQVSGQFDRPSEFLQTLLDIVRVNFEPRVLGTFFLNSNIGLLHDATPGVPFQLGYVSIASAPNKPFGAFWEEDVVPYIKECGYSMEDASSIFAVASTGEGNYNFALVRSVTATLKSGFTVEEALQLIAAAANETDEEPAKRIHAGYCLDAALENKTRLSLWLFIQSRGRTLQ